jgi:hypothetical protein
MKHQDDEQDVLYASGPIMTGTNVRASNPGGRTVEGILQGYHGSPSLAQVLWVDLAVTPARYHEDSFAVVTELDTDEMDVQWRVQENDLIGGWCITSPANDARTPADGANEVAGFVRESTALHIASLHNTWLTGS